MRRMKSWSVALVVIASLASIYFYWNGPEPVELTAEQAAQPQSAAPESTSAEAASGERRSAPQEGGLLTQYKAAVNSVPAKDIQAFIEKGLQGNYDIQTKLKLAEALYDNNYLPKARDLFNSIGDDEMCRYLSALQPGAPCEGDLRLTLGEVLYREGHLKLTMDILGRLVSESVQNMTRIDISAFQTLRMAYRNLGELVKYDSLVDALPEDYPLKPELLKDAAFYYMEAGNQDKANSILMAAAARYPDNASLNGFIDGLTAVEQVQ